jgi:hypothetical protein
MHSSSVLKKIVVVFY